MSSPCHHHLLSVTLQCCGQLLLTRHLLAPEAGVRYSPPSPSSPHVPTRRVGITHPLGGGRGGEGGGHEIPLIEIRGMPLTQSRRPVGRVASVWTLEGTAAQTRMKHTGSETSSEPIWVFTKPQMSDLQTLEILLMGASESPGSASVLQTNDKS